MAAPFALEAVERDKSKAALARRAARTADIGTQGIEDVIWLALGLCALAVMVLSFWI